MQEIKWIKTSEQLPELDSFVAVLVTGKYEDFNYEYSPKLAEFLPDGWMIDDMEDWDQRDFTVDYWMPLAEYPIEVQLDIAEFLSNQEVSWRNLRIKRMCNQITEMLQANVPELKLMSLNLVDDNTIDAVYTFGKEKINIAMDNEAAAVRDIIRQLHWM